MEPTVDTNNLSRTNLSKAFQSDNLTCASLEEFRLLHLAEIRSKNQGVSLLAECSVNEELKPKNTVQEKSTSSSVSIDYTLITPASSRPTLLIDYVSAKLDQRSSCKLIADLKSLGVLLDQQVTDCKLRLKLPEEAYVGKPIENRNKRLLANVAESVALAVQIIATAKHYDLDLRNTVASTAVTAFKHWYFLNGAKINALFPAEIAFLEALKISLRCEGARLGLDADGMLYASQTFGSQRADCELLCLSRSSPNMDSNQRTHKAN